jgi:hypothetical protein
MMPTDYYAGDKAERAFLTGKRRASEGKRGYNKR